MKSYLFLFRSRPDVFRAMSPEEMQATMQKWMAWRAELEKHGRLVDFGNRLEGEGRVIRGKAKTMSDGPFVEVKDAVGGYMMVRCRSLEEATEIALGCPIYERDGTVEIRPVMGG